MNLASTDMLYIVAMIIQSGLFQGENYTAVFNVSTLNF